MLDLSEMLAGSTGLEPAASGVTGRRSNQLNYDPGQNDSTNNTTQRRTAARPTVRLTNMRLVGGTGFEPVTAGV